MSRYQDAAVNSGKDDEQTTRRRFKTHNMDIFSNKAPRAAPVFAITDISRMNKMAECTSPKQLESFAKHQALTTRLSE
jgi:hypothetical protein